MTRDLEHYAKHSATGAGSSILSNRISFFYNLHGPSVTLDTACSSSLVGFHMAHQSIRNGEADMAIAVGSALHYDQHNFITMADMNFLSPDGRCRAFDANGRGYARGEGVCAVILKRTDLANSDGNALRAAVCGTAINHDGYKEGLTMPNSNAQEALMANLYKSIGLPTEETTYFEAHGTGTAAGDPREMRAIANVFAPSRTRPLHVGSVKTNIGHLEGASGLAGIIKTILSLQAGKILPNMHFNIPNPNINFEQWKVSVPTKVLDWEPVNGVRRASINSFGYGGSNAHIILQEVEGQNERTATPGLAGIEAGRPFLLPLTSHTEKAGKILKADLANFLEKTPDVSIADVGRSYSDRGRSLHKVRSFIIGSQRDIILQSLKGPNEAWTRARDEKPRIGFVFTGQGAQWFAMGRQLIEKNAFFRQKLGRCDRILQRLPNKPDWSCINELLKSKDSSRVNEFAMSSPLCCAIQIAIVDLLGQWGIKPTAIVGHSSGEIPAAYAAGILSFEDALTSAYQRGFVLSSEVEANCRVPGAMIAVAMNEQEAARELAPYKGRACIAAANSYSSLTISGDESAILELKEDLEKRQVFVRRLQVERAFHSHHMFPYASALASLTNDLKSRDATYRMVSSVTGRPLKGPEVTGSYFAANLTGKVRFAEALTEILLSDTGEQAVDVLIEIGAHPALKGPSRHSLQGLKLEIPYLSTLERSLPAFESLLCCAGQLFTLGVPVDLEAINSTICMDEKGSVTKTPAGQKIRLPSYSWDHGKYWSETRLIRNQRLRKHRHSLLGVQLPDSTERRPRWRRLLRLSELPWLSDHKIEGNIIFPAAGYFTMAMEAALRLESCPEEIRAISFRDVAIKSALALSDKDSGTEVLLDLQPSPTSAKSASETWYIFHINSINDSGSCVEHCHGLIKVECGPPSTLKISTSVLPLRDLLKQTNKSRPAQKYYKSLESIGLQYGDAFKLISGSVDSGEGSAVASLSLPWVHDDCTLHPTFLDSALHPLFAGLETLLERPLDEPFVPTFLKSMEVSGAFIRPKEPMPSRHVWVNTRTRLPGPRMAINDVSIWSEDSTQMLIEFRGLEVTALGSSSTVDEPDRSLFFRTRWQPAFDSLGMAQQQSPSTIAQIMDVYAHQFPNSKILHITSEASAVEEALRLLGGRNGTKRRFRSLTPFPREIFDDRSELERRWPRLIDLDEPQARDFDVVIVGEPSTRKVVDFLKPGGFVIANGVEFKTQGLSQLFEIGHLSVWQNSDNNVLSAEPVTLITSSDCSDETESLIASVTASHRGPVSQLALSDVATHGLATRDVVVLATLDEDSFDDAGGDEAANFEALKTLFENTNRNIIWITKGASMETSNPEQAMILGLTRTARNENEKLKIVVLDVAEATTPAEISNHIVQVLHSSLREDEVAVREGVLYIPRAESDDELNARLPINSRGNTKLRTLGSDQPMALKVGKVGLLETLCFSHDEAVTGFDLAEHEVEIEVKASSISCRDVGAAVGLVDVHKLGDECAGFILRTGSKVSEFEVGDRVVAWRPGQGAHRTIVRNPASLCFKLGTLPFTIASAMPIILTTAYYALVELASLKAEEYVLIHNAGGGVGQMAVQLGQLVGAKVIATCGSHVNRDLLMDTYDLRNEHILSSRDPSFADDVQRITHGKGVDVVLNCLAGDLLQASWSCIARFGRFIEIGKRDIHENGKLNMIQFQKNVSFHSLDMVTVFEYNKPLGARLLRQSMKLVEEGKIRPPGPIEELSYADAEKGFRLLHSGKHVGKVVLTANKDDTVPVCSRPFSKAQLFNDRKMYLIVGGLGGLGRILAEWMIRKGARSLAFMSRSGISSSQASETVSWLEARDIKIRVFVVDVTDYTAVKDCVDSLGPHLAGVFHAAMVLQDSPIDSMTHQQWQTCIRPKVLGAQNLHHATSHMDLEFFIPFSSVSASIGALAQANYAAANSYLDALVRDRREHGLKASTMNIGMIKGAGVVDRNDALGKIMVGLGLDQVTEDEFLYQVQEAVESGGVPPVDERGVCRYQTMTGINMARKDYYWSKNSFMRNLYSNHDLDRASGETKTTGSLIQNLHAAPDEPSRVAILTSAFLDKISVVLGLTKDLIHPSNALVAYGLDSIVAVELRKWFTNSVRVDLALFDILNAKSITALMEKAVSMIGPEIPVSVPMSVSSSAEMHHERTLVVARAKVDHKGKGKEVAGDSLARAWSEVDRAIKVPSVTVEVVEIEDEDESGPS